MYQLLRKKLKKHLLTALVTFPSSLFVALCFVFISFFNTLLLRIIVNKNIVTKKMVLLIASLYFNTIFSGTRSTSFREKCKIRKLNWLQVIRLYILVNVSTEWNPMNKKKNSLRHLTEVEFGGLMKMGLLPLTFTQFFLEVMNFLVYEIIYCSWSLCPRHKHDCIQLILFLDLLQHSALHNIVC